MNEFTGGFTGGSAQNLENKECIAKAIEEAREGLSRHAPGVNVSAHTWYQLSNRLAFAWKLASEGIPTALIYLGFTGDQSIRYVSDPLEDLTHWRKTVLSNEVLPASLWEREIDCGAAPLWLLIRSRPCARQTPPRIN